MRNIIISALTAAALLPVGAAAQAGPSEQSTANSEQRSPRDSIRMYEIGPQPAVTILASFDQTNRAEALDFVFNGAELDLSSASKSTVQSSGQESSDSETEPAPAESEAPETPE